jgi:hypothetical protein
MLVISLSGWRVNTEPVMAFNGFALFERLIEFCDQLRGNWDENIMAPRKSIQYLEEKHSHF